jgi:uncharacterized protein YbjT (DUF2867 family)
MENSRTFFVTGATGNQGGAAARHLAQAGYKVKALIRNFSSTKISSLRHQNIELIQGDINEPATYRDHLKNVDSVFAVLTYTEGVAKEITKGKALIGAAKDSGVKHFVYSSVLGADSGSGIPHWESKNEIEKHLKSSGVTFTIIRPASLYENFLIPDIRNRIIKGKLVYPVSKTTVQQFIGADDVAKIAVAVFENPHKYVGRTFTVAADQMDAQSVAHVFSEVLRRPIKFSKLPGIFTRIFMGKDLYKMFTYIDTHDVCYIKDLPAMKAEFPFLSSLRQWITNNQHLFS